MRRIFTHAIAAFIAMFLLIALISTAVQAASPASWSGANITYESKTYKPYTADGSTPPELPKNSTYYLYSQVTDAFSGSGKNSILYFNTGPPASATSAQLVVYSVDGSGHYGSKDSGPTTIAIAPQALSASSSQAAWNGNNLEYDSKLFSGKDSKPLIADGSTPAGLAAGTQYYQLIGNPDIGGNGTLYVLYFPAGVDVATQTSATYATFGINGEGQIGGQTGSSKTVTVVPKALSASNDGVSTDESSNSCAVQGIGWIVCPVSEFLAWGMDRIFDMLKGFLEVQPLSTDKNSALYQAWSLVRSIANVAFVIAFLIMIYSQLTSFGLTNYSVKKMVPRLIVAAVLVNLSYLICAVAVDVFNILGQGLQDMLVGIRESVKGPNTNDLSSWQSVTGFILADAVGTGAAVAGLGGVVIANGASLGAAVIMLVPMLLGLLLAILIALLILGARQAVIILLIIAAPLAFVAYLLPNTEKWFEKWRGAFITLLVFFPLFSLIFGGSQLAAFLIIQTANDINVVLLAMFVQVAPLILTPLLVKFSGGIVGRIAGFVNDPKKGLVDRARNWAKTESEHMAARNMARQDPVRRRQIFRRFALGMDQQRRAREEGTKAYKEVSEARWTNTREYSDIQQRMRYAEDSKTIGMDNANARYDRAKSITGSNAQNLEYRSRVAKQRLENAKSLADVNWEGNQAARAVQERLQGRVLKDQLSAIQSTNDAHYEEFKQGRVGTHPYNAAVGAMLHQVQQDTRLVAMNAMRSESAKRAVNEQFTKDLEANTQRMFNGQLLQTYAGGVQGIEGAQRALAAAISAQSEAHSSAVKNAATILAHGNYGDDVIGEIALGNSAGTNIIITNEMQEAAIAKIAGGANTVEILKLMENLEINPTDANQDFRQTFADTLLANGNKPKFAGAGILAAAKQGIAPPTGKARMDQWIAETINANKLGSAELLVSHDRDYLTAVLSTIRYNTSHIPLSRPALAKIKSEIHLAKTDHRFSGRIGERAQVLDDIEAAI